MKVSAGESLTRLKIMDRNGKLTPRLRHALHNVDPDWNTDFYARLWTDGLTALTAYVRREGHARVPQTHVEDGFPLGKWVANRRGEHRSGKLSSGRRDILNSVAGWVWEPFADQYAVGLHHLDAHITETGSARVPRHHKRDGFALGSWCDRRRIDREAGRLSDERAAELEARRGWEWRPAEADYARNLAALIQYTTRTGDARVPRTHVEDGLKLGNWVAARRRDHAAGKLSDERAAELEQLAGWRWSVTRC